MDSLYLFKQSPLFSTLSDAQLSRLAESCSTRLLESGERLVRFGSPCNAVVYLAQGTLALYRRNKSRGTGLLLGMVEGPAVVGDAEWAAGSSWMVSARAEVDSTAVLIPFQTYEWLIEQSAQLTAKLYRDACVRHLLANHTAQTAALYTTSTRILRLLLDYGKIFGEREGDDLRLKRVVTKAEIATGLGVTRKTVQRTIQLLIEKGDLEMDGPGQWRIKNLLRLQNELPATLFGLHSRYDKAVVALTEEWDRD